MARNIQYETVENQPMYCIERPYMPSWNAAPIQNRRKLGKAGKKPCIWITWNCHKCTLRFVVRSHTGWRTREASRRATVIRAGKERQPNRDVAEPEPNGLAFAVFSSQTQV
jgi:hypothetical protein